jgi:hypothetical protein
VCQCRAAREILNRAILNSVYSGWLERREGDVRHEVRQCGAGRENVVHHIEHSLLGGALGENRGLGDVKLQANVLKEYQFELLIHFFSGRPRVQQSSDFYKLRVLSSTFYDKRKT